MRFFWQEVFDFGSWVNRVAVAAADWWLPVTALQSPIDGVNSSTGCNWFIRLRLCSLPLQRFRNGYTGWMWTRMVLLFSSVNCANLFQVAGDVDSEAEEKDEDDVEYMVTVNCNDIEVYEQNYMLKPHALERWAEALHWHANGLVQRRQALDADKYGVHAGNGLNLQFGQRPIKYANLIYRTYGIAVRSSVTPK
ncbi:hypothetical protein Tco_1267853 [Tanacetum coccineum]